MQGPQVQHESGRNAEAQEVRQAVELRPEPAGAAQQARDTAVQPVDARGDQECGRSIAKPPFQPESHAGQARAQAQHGHEVRDHAVEGQAAHAGALALFQPAGGTRGTGGRDGHARSEPRHYGFATDHGLPDLDQRGDIGGQIQVRA